MGDVSNKEAVAEKIAFVKRNCVLCKGRSRLRLVKQEKDNVKSGLKNLVEFFNNQFNALRGQDAETRAINNAIGNKRLCMDLFEECEKCDKEVDLVNRGLNKIKQ